MEETLVPKSVEEQTEYLKSLSPADGPPVTSAIGKITTAGYASLHVRLSFASFLENLCLIY